MGKKRHNYKRRSLPAVDKPPGDALPQDLNCGDCPLLDEDVNTRGVPTFSYGYDPQLFIIAEAPGKNEDEQGEPMVGSAGNIQWQLVNQVGIYECVIGNCIRCRPPGNRDPLPDEIRICSKHLYRDLRRIKPKVVLLAGAFAVRTFLDTKVGVEKLRGWQKMSVSRKLQLDAYVTYHPSSVHYDSDKKAVIENDLRLVKRRLDGEAPSTLEFKWKYLDTIPKLKKAVDKTLTWEGPIGFDFETLDLNVVETTPYSLSWGQGKGLKKIYGVPLQHPDNPWDGKEYEQVKKLLRYMIKQLLKKKVKLTAHNAKFDLSVFADSFGVNIPEVICTMQGAHTVDENRLKGGGGFGLKSLTVEWLGFDMDVWDKDTFGKLYGGRVKEISPKKLTHHGAIDVATQVELYYEVRRRAENEGLDLDRLSPLLNSIPSLLSAIERNGMPVDINTLSKFRSDKGPLLTRKQEIIQELEDLPTVQKVLGWVQGGGKDIKMERLFGSGKRKGFAPGKRSYTVPLFFDILQLEPTGHGKKKTDRWPGGEPSIDQNFLDTYKNVQECALIQEWRGLDKMIGTYIESWWEFTKNSPDCRIRSSFHSARTKTGRLSSSDPNLQQIPSGKTEAAKAIKKVFRPHSVLGETGLKVIVACDYSQAELRWLADIAGDKTLSRIYQDRAEVLHEYGINPSKKLAKRIDVEFDLHYQTAAEIEGVPVKDVTKDQRRAAKGVNFGVGYGQTSVGLAAALGISEEDAEAKIETWMSRFYGAKEWFDYIENFAVQYGYVESPIGRRRHLSALMMGLMGKGRGHSLRVARNAPVQSIASDMTLWAAIRIQRYATKFKKPWKLVGLVHDSILAEIPIEDVLAYIKVARSIAESRSIFKAFGIERLGVPQEFEAEVGLSYGELITLTPSVKEQEREIDKIYEAWKKSA